MYLAKVVFLVLITTLSFHTKANVVEKINEFLDNEKYEEAYNTLYNLENHNPETYFLYGVMYHYGLHVEKDTDKAIHYYKIAFDQGNYKAGRNLAEIYLVDFNDEEHIKKAKYILEDENFELDGRGYFLLYIIYSSEKDTSETKIYSLLNNSSEMGFEPALLTLAFAYLEEIIVEQDIEKSFNLFKSDMLNDNEYAKFMINTLNTIKSHNISHLKFNDTERMVFIYLEMKKNTEGDFSEDIFSIHIPSFLYHSDEDHEALITWLHIGAAENNFYAISLLAQEYETGIKIERDMDKALFYYRKAADLIKNDESVDSIKFFSYFTDDILEKARFLNIDAAYYDNTSAPTSLIELLHYHINYPDILNSNKLTQDIILNRIINQLDDDAAVHLLLTTNLLYENSRSEKHTTYYKVLGSYGLSSAVNKYFSILIEDNIEKGIDWLKEESYKDNSQAQFILGVLYGSGDFVEEDIDSSLYFLKSASRNSHIEASEVLGDIYSNGLIIDVDYVQALKYYTLAMNLGSIDAMFYLSNLYRDGKGTPQNFQESIRLLELAANNNHMTSQINLAVVYARGEITERNLILAHKWSNIAASSGNQKAVEIRELVTPLLSKEDLLKAQAMASEWYSNQ